MPSRYITAFSKGIGILGLLLLLATTSGNAQGLGNPTGPDKDKFKTGPQPKVTSPKTAPTITAAAVSSTALFPKPVDLRLLVLAADGTEPSFAALQAFLDQIGIPYSALALAPPNGPPNNLPPLTDGTKGYFHGIVLTTGNLAVCDPNCHSALPTAGWQALDDYMVAFGVRAASYYTFPEARYGLAWTGSTTETGSIAFLPAAATIFPYLRQANPVALSNAYTYFAVPVQDLGEITTPILSMGIYTVGVTHQKPDGREYLALTMDNNPNLFHSMALHYGLFNWLTKGVFLGARKVYLTPQVDDIFIADDLFAFSPSVCLPSGFQMDPTFDSLGQCPALRITGADLDALATWQDNLNNQSNQTANVTVAFAFNGFGTTAAGGSPTSDTLLASATAQKNKFYWINHTYDHENLDCYNPVPNSGICQPATQVQSKAEIVNNVKFAKTLGLPFDDQSMVTPDLSGQSNSAFLKVAVNNNIIYLITDYARMNPPPRPNTGFFNAKQPKILMIPRHATNIFYNVFTSTTSAVGSETDEYNYFYGPNGIARLPDGSPFFSTDQTYAQIVDRESDAILRYMLRFEAYPHMFHQSNLVQYASSQSLLTDVVGAAIQKFTRLSNLKILSQDQNEIGQLLKKRMAYNNSGVQATLTPGVGITLTVVKAATIPITGICKTNCQTYGGQNISNYAMQAGQTIAIAF